MSIARIDVFSHYFKVSEYNRETYQKLLEYCRPLIQTGLEKTRSGRFKPTMLKIFAASTAERDEIRLHVNLLRDFFTFMKNNHGYGDTKFEIVRHEIKEPSKLKSKIRAHLKLRDYQEPIVDFVLEEGKHCRVVGIQTGRGKTFTALKAVELIGYRTLIVVPAMYADKWYGDVLETFDTDKKNVLYLKGAKSLSAAFKLAAKDELPQEFLITTSTTIQIFLRNYEMEKQISLERDPHPEKLYEELGVGVRIVDELHKNIHLNIKMDLYTNIYKTIGLSATMQASNPFINKMTDMAYPIRDRYQGLAYVRYIDVYALEYRFAQGDKVRCKGSKGEYSHVVFEQWLMRNPKLLDNYTNMILDYVEQEFIKPRKPEHTSIVFAATIDYCTHLTACAKARWPDLDIARYIGEDDYSRLMEAELVFSTVLSAGTAVDKYGLTDVFMSTSIDSIQSNEQAMGRLRELKQWPDMTPRFHYFFAGNIEKQVTYHERKKVLFEHKAKNQFHCIMSNVI